MPRGSKKWDWPEAVVCVGLGRKISELCLSQGCLVPLDFLEPLTSQQGQSIATQGSVKRCREAKPKVLRIRPGVRGERGMGMMAWKQSRGP